MVKWYIENIQKNKGEWQMNKKLFKGKKSLSFYIFILGIFLVGITLGSSLLSSTLKIIGASEVKKNSWIIYFDDIDIAEDSAPNSNSNDNARIAKNGEADPTKQNIEFTASLKNPGDFYEFTVWTVNDGSIDAEIESLEKSVLTAEQQKYLDFDVVYDDGTPIEVCDILYHKDSTEGPNKRLVKAIVKYKKGISVDDYPKDGVTLNLYFKINYKQRFSCEPTEIEEKHKLSIRPNGGVYEGRKSQTRIYLKQSESYLLSRPTRELYNFDGWKVISPETGGTYELEPNDDKYLFTMGSEDVLIEAKWKEGDYVARIMDHYYTKVELAFDAVDGNDPSTGRPWQNNTVWLIKDTDEVALNTATSNFTFDLGGHTLTGKIVNPSTGKIAIVNGVVQGSSDVEESEKQRRIDEGKNPVPYIEDISGEGILNYGILTVGKDDGTVEVDNSISIIGNQYGIYNVSNSKFKFYDGYIQSRDAFSGLTVNYSTGDMQVATNHFTFIDHRQENEKDYQKVYLTPSPNRAVVKTTTVIPAYYYNLQDAINSVLNLKQQNTSLTDNDYIIEAIRTFEAAYDLEVQLKNSNGENITTNENNARVFFDLKGYSIQTGKPITNNGYFKIYNSKENNSIIQVSKSIVNNKSLEIDNLKVISSTPDDAIINKDKLKLTDVIVNSHEGYSVKNIENGTLDFNDNVVLRSVNQTDSAKADQYALYNSGTNATLNNGTIYGLYNTGTITISGSNTEYLPIWNDTDRNGNKVYLKAIYNSGNITMNDGIVSTNLNTTLIDNDGTFTFNDGTINSDYLVVDNSGTFNVKGSEVVSSQTAITGGTVNVDGGNVRTSTTDAITWSTVNVKNGEVIAEDGVAVGDHSTVNIMGGTVTGTTYGVYGSHSSINVSSGLLSAPIAASVATATVTGGKVIGSEYAIIAGNTTIGGGEITSPKNAIVTTDLNMTGGKVNSTNEVGITINGTGTIAGGEVYGGTYGVLSKDTLTLGSDDGVLSGVSPLLEGELLGLFIEGNTTNFYDGILKGQRDGYEGTITGTPLGGVVGEGSEARENDELYNTDFISSFNGWLRIGDTTYNTLNEASSAIGDGESGTIIVTRDADIKFAQQVVDDNHNKNITLDLNGHVVTTTQTITNNSNFTIIDSSTSTTPYEDVGNSVGTLKILKNNGILNEYKLVIDGGRYESITDYVIVNKTYQLEENTNNVIQGTVINSGTFNVTNSVVLNGLYENNQYKSGHLRINGINVETSKNTFINSRGDIEINGTKNNTTGENTTVINATNNIINNETSVVINGGKLFAVNSISTGEYGTVQVNEKKTINLDDDDQVAFTELKTTESHALYSYWGDFEINGGTIETRDTTAVTTHHAITVNGGTIKGTRGVKNEMWCTWTTCGFEPITVTDGTIIGTQYEGAYLTGGYGYFKGGLFIGQTDGIYSLGTSILGIKGESLNITKPEARGIDGYGFNNHGYMNFYDGILKGKKKTGIANSSHNGMIQRIEDATQVKRDYEYINNVYYETEYLETQGDWLEIEGKGTYNTVDKACAAASNGDTIKVIADTHIAFEEYCPSGKTLIFDENGHSVSFTQPITFDSDITFKDSVGNGLLHDENHNMIINGGTSTIESGNYKASGANESIAFVNRGTLTITGGTFSSTNSSAIFNQGTMTYNVLDETSNVSSETTYGITNNGTLNFKNGHIKTYGGIYNNATLTIDNGIIEGTEEYSLYGHAGMATINGGQLINDVRESIVLNCSGDLTINDGVITSTVTNGIHVSGGGNGCDSSLLYVNGGNITGKTNGIVNGSSASYIEINGGNIKGQNNNGVNINNCNTNINGGIIEGGVYGVYTNQDYDTYTTQLGDNDSNVAIDAPVLKGELFGLYINKGTLNFYDGVLKGQNEGFIGQITNIADRTELYYEDDEVINEVNYQVVYLLAEKIIARNIDKPHGDLSYTEYTNLQDAFSEASNGDTIELVDNAPIYYPITNNKDVTLDMKGYVISTNKMITNNGELEIKNTNTTRESEIKTSSALSLISSTGNIKLENITLKNTSSSLYVLQTSGETVLKNVKINSILGINSSNKLTITNSTISTSNTAINNTGILSIDGGSYSGSQYSIYSNSSNDVNVKNANLSGIFYNSGNNISRLENSTLTGELQNRTSNLTVLESTLNRDVSNTGTVLIDTSHVRDSITNNGTMTILDSDVVGASGDVINNSGTMTIKNSSTNLIGIYYYYYTTYTGITNTGTLNIDNSIIEQDTRDNHASETHAINNSGTLNINNKSKIIVGMDTRQSNTLMGIYSSGNGKANIIDSNILVKNANIGYGVYTDSDNSSVKFTTTRTYPEETELLALQDELAELSGEEHGLSETNEQITATVKIGKIEVINSNNSYGAYINKGTFELGVEDGAGDEHANVSIFKPLVRAIGTIRGIAIKKVDGLFNFYDGRIVGSRYAKPETTSKVEHNYEVTTYVDFDTGYEYAYLEYMKEDYEYSNAIASITGRLNTLYYPSVKSAIEAYLIGIDENVYDGTEEITLLQSTVEGIPTGDDELEDPITIPANANIRINLNGRSITTKFVNNGTLSIYNGSVQNFNKEAIINNGTLYMGQDDTVVSSTNIRVISEVAAIRNNGTFIMYDGYLEGNPSINGNIDQIAEFSRIYTVKDNQSEKKYLQSLDKTSIENRDTALFITIDPLLGFYDGHKGSQVLNQFYGDVVKIKDPTKSGCDFLGWDLEGETTLIPIEEGSEDYQNGYRYQFTVGLTDITLTAKWQVSENAVAKIGEEYFNSVSDAIMEASDGDKIELIKDVVEDVSNNKNITLDLSEHKLTGEFINTGILRLLNGTIENPTGIGIWNKKTLIVGENDITVSMDSVKIIGKNIGIQNDGGLRFYDGYIEGEVALVGDVDQVPQGFFLYIEHNSEKDCQREYLIGSPENAVAITKNSGGEESTVQYFFSLQDAIDTATISGKEIFIVKDFTATYTVSTVENSNIVINLDGHDVQFGSSVTNNGTLKLYDTYTPDDPNEVVEKGTITTASTIKNNGTLTVEDISVSQSKDYITLQNNEGATLNLKSASINALNANAVKSEGTLNLVGENNITSNTYALVNDGNELTISSGVITGIISSKDLTINEGATISTTSSSVAAIVPRAKLTVNGGRITATNCYGIYNDTSDVSVEINGGTFTGRYGMYCNSAANYVLNDATIETTSEAITMVSNNCNFEMNGGKVESPSHALYITGSYHKADVKGGELKSTGTYGVSIAVNSAGGCDYTQTGGTVIGASHGLYSSNANINILGGEVRTTSTNNGHYAIYNDWTNRMIIGGDAFINAPNASGLRTWTTLTIKDNAHIYAGGSTAQGILFGDSTVLTIQDNALIETTSPSSVGVQLYDSGYSPTVNMTGGTIKSDGIGLSTSPNNTSKVVNITGGKIIGETYGIYQVSSNSTVNIGSKDSELSTTLPMISGGNYAIYKTAGNLRFYNGRLRGYTYGYTGTINSVRANKEITKVIEPITGSEKELTYSILDISREPISNYAKIGNGHARITYIGEDSGTCIKNTATDFIYSGEEDEFIVTCPGKYKLEVWGASGGGEDANANRGSRAGAGGYSTGEITLNASEKLYINVGGQGAYGSGSNVYGGPKGGYNGGGDGGNYISGAGGGATHIATSSGLLSTLENNKSAVLIVAGGGGGSDDTDGSGIKAGNDGSGGSGGGATGAPAQINGVNTSRGRYTASASGDGGCGSGGSQTRGYAFGKGESVNYSTDTGGAGAGWYGGYVTNHNNGGAGGGSGYIANTRLSNAAMYGYNVDATKSQWVVNYLVEKDNYLQVDNEFFNSINDAVKYIVDNKEGKGTILLLDDVETQEDAKFDAGTDIVFNLQNNKITTTKRIINKGKLKIINGTIEDIADDTVQNENDLTVENCTFTSHSDYTGIYVPGNLSTTAKLSVKDSKIYGGLYGISASSREDITVDNSEIKGSDVALYLNSSYSTLDFKSGKVIGNGNIGIIVSDYSTTHITSGSIESTTHGIYGRCQGATITIDDMTITSTNNEAIRFDNYSTNYNTLTINSGTYKGADHGIVSQTTHLIMKDSTVETSSTNVDRYAIYIYNYADSELNNVTVKATNASGMYINTDTVTLNSVDITAGKKNSRGIRIEGGTTNFSSSTINTSGIESKGVDMYNGTFVMNSGSIDSNHTGIYMDRSAKAYIYGGTIYARIYGIREHHADSVLTIGKSSDTLNIEAPLIRGKEYGIYKENGSSYFYNGKLGGSEYGFSSEFNEIRQKMEIAELISYDEHAERYTISTKNVSSTPTSKYAKAGNGHARFTYLGETNETCTNNQVYDISYSGEEYVFNTPCPGDYKIEVWGAAGGYTSETRRGGYGGYATGTISLGAEEKLYVNVGGQGTTDPGVGGYNGGGSGGSAGGSGGGGGATHVALKSGLLSTLENDKSSVLIVAGGGGGYAVYGCSTSIGGSGGGQYGAPLEYGGSQTQGGSSSGQTGGSFGKGGYQSNTYHSTPGAGAGWYGGGTDTAYCGAGGGSGYVGNTRLSNAYMYGYEVEGTEVLWVYNYLVSKKVFLQVDDEKFNSFDDAVEYIVDNKNGIGTILLIEDATMQEDGTVTSGTDITLDLQDNTLTATAPIYNKGKFKVVDGTLNNIADNTVQNEGELTLENVEISSGSTSSVVYVPSNLSNRTKLSIKDSTLTGGSYGIYNNSAEDITIENTDITSSEVTIYMNASETKLDFESGNIEATNGIGIYVIHNADVHITSGKIDSKTYGIYGHCQFANITIDTMNITSTDNEAIRLDAYNGNYNTLNILGGTYKGADYGIVANSTHSYIKNSTIETSSTNKDEYVIHAYYAAYLYLENCVLNAPNASGIYNQADSFISGTTINVDSKNGYGIFIDGGTVTLNDGTKINTTGSSSYGIYTRYNSPTIKILDADIESKNIGVYLTNTVNFSIYNGKIVGYTYGIQETNGSNVVNIGEPSQDVSIYKPFIEGGLYGIYKSDGTLNFYNGRLKGLTGPYYGVFNNIKEGYEVHEEADGVEVELQNARTFSTSTASSSPIENSAKKGNGYAKITYNRLDYVKSKYTYDDTDSINKTVYDYSYVGDTQVFTTPVTGDYKVELWGAQGGDYNNNVESGNGHHGGYTSGTIHLEKGTKLYVYVGQGLSCRNCSAFNATRTSTGSGNPGGGATDVRLIAGEWDSLVGLRSRIMVAGGGGSSEGGDYGGASGGLVGYLSTRNSYVNTGGSQVGPGIGQEDPTGCATGDFGKSSSCGATGGGGYYGGGGASHRYGSGSGGSSFISGHKGAVAVTSINSTTPRLDSNNVQCTQESAKNDITCSYHYSGYKFTDTVMIDGLGYEWNTDVTTNQVGNPTVESSGIRENGHTGNGYARITLLSNENINYNVKFINEQGTTVTKQYLKNSTLGTLEDATTNRTDIEFEGWYLEPTYVNKVTSSYVVNKNINLYAKYVYNTSAQSGLVPTSYTSNDILHSEITNVETNFSYTGEQQTFVVPVSGYYKLEAWGASGGIFKVDVKGGYGGYSKGNIYLTEGQTLYINVGGKGVDQAEEFRLYTTPGGYNGGGNGGKGSGGYPEQSGGSGGGATHIALAPGLLQTFDTNEDNIADAEEIEDLLIVAGGGGGASYAAGGSGGGATGASSIQKGISDYNYPVSAGGTQTTGYLFGKGQSGRDSDNSYWAAGGTGGGGGGFYGGYTYQNVGQMTSGGGGGGSGYIGNNSLSNKAMYCYNCTESDAENTKTISISDISDDAESEKAKVGNGHARITLVSSSSKANLYFMHDYGTLTNDTVSYDIGASLGTLPIPTYDESVMTFKGWYYEPTYETQVQSTDQIVNDTRIFAKFTYAYSDCDYEDGRVFTFDYLGREEVFMATCPGEYKLETWGAQGADYSDTNYGGYGSYSVGKIELTKNEKLYINVGGQGVEFTGGYNGGGNAGTGGSQTAYAGGGATHIALKSGLLSSLEDSKDKILIVSGGGGGAGYAPEGTTGGNAGGYIGNSGIDGHNHSYTSYNGTGATQEAPGYAYSCGTNYSGSFGQGGNYCNSGYGGSGGGGGYYGGGGSNRGHGAGGGGSGYVGNSRLYDKYMYGYEVTTMNDGLHSTVAYLVLTTDFVKNKNKPEGSNTYKNLQEAINYASDGDELELTGDASLSYELVVEKNITLDLNGYNLSTTKPITNKKTLNITNSSTQKKSTITNLLSSQFITNTTNSALTFNNVIIKGNSLISNSSSATLGINNSELRASSTALSNTGTMTITNSVVEGTTYAVYDNSSSTNSTISNTDLISSNTGLYANGTGKVVLEDTDISGIINVNNANSEIKISKNNNDTVEIKGRIENKGQLEIKDTDISYTYYDYGQFNLIYNSGLLTLKDNNIVLNSGYGYSADSEERILYSNGTVSSIGNNYLSKRLDTSQSKSFINIYNEGILTSTNDKLEGRYGKYYYGIYTNSSHDSTITNVNIKSQHIRDYDYGIMSTKSLNTITGANIELFNNNESKGIYVKDTAVVKLNNIAIDLHDNTTSIGLFVKSGELTMETGTITSSGTEAYGAYMEAGTYTQGIYDGRGTDSADVSITNPEISATGTTKGIGVRMGNGEFNYYDGHISGSTSAFEAGDIVASTEHRYHVEYSNDNKSCILKFNM